MVKRVINIFGKEISGIHSAAYLLAIFTLVSQFMALFRDKILAHIFGGGLSLDIYYAAFKIPDFVFATVGSFVSISVLVPMLAKKAHENPDQIKKYIDSIFTAFYLLMIFVCIVCFFAMPYFVSVLFKGFDPSAQIETVHISRILLLSPLLLGLSNFFGSIVQYQKRFLIYSISPVFYNLGIILAILVGAKRFGIIAVVYGVIIGAVLHLLIQFGYVFLSGNSPTLRLKINK